MAKLTIVFGFKNRDTLRVKRCFDSLLLQTFIDFEVVLVDYGSDADVSKEIKSLVAGYSFVRYVYTETRCMPWNRSNALNIGIRLSKSEYIMTSDVDLIFSNNVLNHLMGQTSPQISLHAACYYLPRDFNDWSEVGVHVSHYGSPNYNSLGLLLLLPREIHLEIGGFDEYYKFWGLEDADIENRLLNLGWKTKYVNIDECLIYHQWHEVKNSRSFSFMPEGFWSDIQIYYAKNKSEIKRNDNIEWGCLLGRDERPALTYLDGDMSPAISIVDHEKLEVELISSLDSIVTGEAVEILTSWSAPSAPFEAIAHKINYIMLKLGIMFFVDYRKNHAKDVFWKLIDVHNDVIQDYAYSIDETRFIIVKG